MHPQPRITCSPAPGSRHLLFCSDFFRVSVTVEGIRPGDTVHLRSNINQSRIIHQDLIARVELNQPLQERSWQDEELNLQPDGSYNICLPILQPGHFECKPFLRHADGSLSWPEGGNISVNAQPSSTRAGNTLYCAFVRQFGRHKELESAPPLNTQELAEMDRHGYTVIPPSGTFRDLIAQLDHIFGTLGCKILHLLPINPTPTSYGRMGRYGSPYAALDFTAVNPELCRFDLHHTPLEQFLELVDQVHARQGRLFLDIAINHTGWAAKIHETHPEWLKRDAGGKIHQPGAWGTVWEDLTELDHSRPELWIHLAEVFLTWCRRGVDGFRCDAGYMVPEAAWTYIVAKVRQHFPQTVFLLEGLGGPWETTERLLEYSNINWAYSELFQNYDKAQISWYLSYSTAISSSRGLMVHYAETHDNLRLAARSQEWARLRLCLSALLSHGGSFGFTNGVEFFATEKINVHGSSGLRWGAEDNCVPLIATLNRLLRAHPAFRDGSTLREIHQPAPKVFCALRTARDGSHPLLLIFNLDDQQAADLDLELPQDLASAALLHPLLDHASPPPPVDGRLQLRLAPAEVLALESQKAAFDEGYLPFANAQAACLTLLNACGWHLLYPRLAAETTAMLQSPRAWLRKLAIPSLLWEHPRDMHRQTPCPPGITLVIRAANRFRCRILGVQHESFHAEDGLHYVIIPPLPDRKTITLEKLQLQLFGEQIINCQADLVLSSAHPQAPIDPALLPAQAPLILATNGRGAMLRTCADLFHVHSKYDGLLAANFSPTHPENRHVFWRRCRLYASMQGQTHPLGEKTLVDIQGDGATTAIIHQVPCGLGKSVRFEIRPFMIPLRNASCLFIRRLSDNSDEFLDDAEPLELFIRPDVEDRDFHMETHAHSGPADHWPRLVSAETASFTFSPHTSRQLRIASSRGTFTRSDEWTWGHHHGVEASRGLSSSTDMFSPGFFKCSLLGGEAVNILGQALSPTESSLLDPNSVVPPTPAATADFRANLTEALDAYIVNRDDLKTVIAGYPWFLDWGRDTLICCRGLISAGRLREVRQILLRFAAFERHGTLPNAIHGGDASDRDTSDAPLWLFVATADYIRAAGGDAILREDCAGRPLLDVLISIIEHYARGTPNGIRMDPESALIYSPPHFTWMDTNYPAGTPREGYPIEIQALWWHALNFVNQHAAIPRFAALADQVCASFTRFFRKPSRAWLSDCLHTHSFQPAAAAKADDALRSNQLFAVTLGLVSGDTALDVVESSFELLIPGAIRSLADRSVDYQLPVYSNGGQLLNHPSNPYWPRYDGDEDTRRKPAYHNGTAWVWPFPSYCEAFAIVHGREGQRTALAMLATARIHHQSGCWGHLPEILDGSSPHRPRGCDAQAWSDTELLRVMHLLAQPLPPSCEIRRIPSHS